MGERATGKARNAGDVGELRALERRRDYEALIAGLRERVSADRRVLTSRWVKGWCGRRWRDLFLTGAAEDPRAVKAATGRGPLRRDERPLRQRLAERFLHSDIDDWRLELPPGPCLRRPKQTLVFCPGLVSRMIPVAGLGQPLAALAADCGLRVVRADAHPVRGCEANMADLLNAIERGRGHDAAGQPIGRARRPGDVVLLGYSKGTPDALTLLAHRPDVAPRVRALVCWAGAVGGSYLADDAHRTVSGRRIDLGPASGPALTLIKALLPIAQLEGALERADEWDLEAALLDLTTRRRAAFLRRHRRDLDALDVPIFNLVAVAGPLEVPYFQMQGSMDIARRAGPNDMQLSIAQATLRGPMATTLAVVHAHHWDIAYDPFPVRSRLGSPNLDHPFPRKAAVVATLGLLSELGLVVKEQPSRGAGS